MLTLCCSCAPNKSYTLGLILQIMSSKSNCSGGYNVGGTPWEELPQTRLSPSLSDTSPPATEPYVAILMNVPGAGCTSRAYTRGSSTACVQNIGSTDDMCRNYPLVILMACFIAALTSGKYRQESLLFTCCSRKSFGCARKWRVNA